MNEQALAEPDTTDETATAVATTVAGIDIGSNALRFIVAEIFARDTYRVVESERSPVRLGHEAFTSGILSQASMDAVIETLSRFQARFRELHVDQIRAIATSAVREADNGAELVARAESETGIHIDVITGAEEARLVRNAVQRQIDFGSDRWLIADLGGGSVEVSLVDTERTRWSVSHRAGAVRLLAELGGESGGKGSFRRRVEECAAAMSLPRFRKKRPVGFAATGGNIEALADLVGAARDERGVARLQREDLHAAIDRLAAVDPEERVTRFGLRPDRADVILPAAIVYEWLATACEFDVIHVPFVGVKDGLVLDLAHEMQAVERARELDRVVYTGALSLGRRFRFDGAHGRQVARLARSLFDQLHDVHGLAAADRRILTAAAMLHDVGVFISHRGHHRHSLYIISQSELPGLTPNEILMVANIARYHRKAEPRTEHEEFARLGSSDRDRVLKLAAILRIADGLDREHRSVVQSVRARVKGSRLILTLASSGDLALETWAVKKKADLFARMFGLRLKIKENAAA